MKRSPIRQKSAKRVIADREMVSIRKAVFERDQRCMAPIDWGRCEGVWDAHHVVSRARDRTLALEPSNLKTLCRKHHDRTHADPLNATACGLMKSA